MSFRNQALLSGRLYSWKQLKILRAKFRLLDESKRLPGEREERKKGPCSCLYRSSEYTESVRKKSSYC